MKIRVLFFFILLSTTFCMRGQVAINTLSELQAVEDSLNFYGEILRGDKSFEDREKAAKRSVEILAEALTRPGSFDYAFQRLETISMLSPPDKSFRIFTAQFFVDDQTYKYFGGIQLPGSPPRFIPLNDKASEIEDFDEVLNAERWYGALYYNILPFEGKDDTKHYLLLGFNGFSFFNKRKLIDIITIKDGQATFGAPVFVKQKNDKVETYNRVMFQYSADATLSCNYDVEKKMIVFDHLIPSREIYPGQGPTFIPDGTYDAYKLRKGVWVYQDNLPVTPMKEAPTPVPLSKNRKNYDLFGKEKKKADIPKNDNNN